MLENGYRESITSKLNDFLCRFDFTSQNSRRSSIPMTNARRSVVKAGLIREENSDWPNEIAIPLWCIDLCCRC